MQWRGPDLTARYVLHLKESALSPVLKLWAYAQQLVAGAEAAGLFPGRNVGRPNPNQSV